MFITNLYSRNRTFKNNIQRFNQPSFEPPRKSSEELFRVSIIVDLFVVSDRFVSIGSFFKNIYENTINKVPSDLYLRGYRNYMSDSVRF